VVRSELQRCDATSVTLIRGDNGARLDIIVLEFVLMRPYVGLTLSLNATRLGSFSEMTNTMPLSDILLKPKRKYSGIAVIDLR
jgi:hypothetical protein